MSKAKILILIISDVAILYGALILTLVLRYGASSLGNSFNDHLIPFSIIFFIWLIVFYLSDLYRNKNLRTDQSTSQVFIFGIFISVIVSIILFYLFPGLFKLTPKTNLVIFAVIFGIIDFIWRAILIKLFIASGLKNKLLIVGNSPAIGEISDYLKNNPQTGYTIAGRIENTENYSAEKLEKEMNAFIKEWRLNTVVIQSSLKKNTEIAKTIYKLLSSNIAVLDLASFYEILFGKIPLREVEEDWFIEKIITRRRFYDTIKRVLDLFLAIILTIVFSPLILLFSFLIKLTSRGPILFIQKRMGKGEKPFMLYKFRTMRENNNGPLWTTQKDDRITFIGKILRHNHLDELPQLFNIIKGSISFTGPRAERIELSQYYRQLPRYEIRHIIKPGLTGWAQLNYKPSASLEEAEEKLRYDIYYIKNRSFILDFLILLKTVKYLFVSNGKS